MATVFAAPVIVKVLGSLAFILVANRLLRQLGVAMALGTVVLAVWTGHGATESCRIALNRLLSANHILLLVIVFQVCWLGGQMAKAGIMRDLVAVVRRRLSQRAAMGVLPAVIGLLPMPGGALFSAPLVGDCDQEGAVQPVLKAQVNYWFRHVWEFWWPLYPGVLLALDITRLDVWQIALIHIPLSVLAMLSGRIFLLRRIGSETLAPEPEPDRDMPSFLALMTPILIVIGVYTAIRLLLPGVVRLNKYLPMVVGIFAAMLWAQRMRPLPRHEWRGILFSKRLAVLALLVSLVRVYGAFIEAPLADGMLLVEAMRAELDAWGIPVAVIIMVVPFVSGLATGLAIGFVGASFPIVVSLLGPDPALSQLLAATVLGYGFGYMGMMLSPVHICLIVTNEHFASQLTHSLKGLVPPALCMMAGTALLAALIRSLPLP